MHGHQTIGNLLLHNHYEQSTMIEIGSERGLGSTSLLASLAKKYKLHFITVDIMEETQKRVEKIVTDINPNFRAVCMRGEEFLKIYPRRDMAIIYLDAFDITYPNKKRREDRAEIYQSKGLNYSNESSWKMHLECCQNMFNKMRIGGFVVFDDSWIAKNKDGSKFYEGKGRTAIPFLLNNGYVRYKQFPYVTILKREK